MDMSVFVTCIIIFFARIVDVSVGTIRILSIVQGRIKTAFVLGFLEVSIWLWVISSVMEKIKESPVIAVFYALGYASGNVVGIKIEKWLSMGNSLLRIISFEKGREITEKFKEIGYTVIIFNGVEKQRPVVEIEIPCRRDEIEFLVKKARELEPEIYYVTEAIGLEPEKKLPVMIPATGWRAVFKRK